MRIKMKTCMAGPEGTVYPEQEVDIENEKAIELVNGGYAVALEEFDIAKATNRKDGIYPKHIAGGLYLLSSGDKVRGKEAALEAQKALEGGGENGSQINSGTDDGTAYTGGSEELS